MQRALCFEGSTLLHLLENRCKHIAGKIPSDVEILQQFPTSLTVGVPLYFEHDAEDGTGAQGHLINLIDSPGHADLSSEADPSGDSGDSGGGSGGWLLGAGPSRRIWNFVRIARFFLITCG